MRALLFHFSSLVGLLVFLNQLWNAAEIERTVFVAFGTGLALYTLLLLGYAAARSILAATPPAEEPAEASPGALDKDAGERTTRSRTEHPTP